MKKLATICALIGTLALGGLAQSKPAPDKHTFNLVKYIIKTGVTIDDSEFGDLIDSQKGRFNIGGRYEIGIIEMYDVDKDNYPDVMVIRRANSNIISIGLDYGSKTYEPMKKKLGNRVTPYKP